jgi:hypothetical protein|tara:strand:+ start:418 stop:732 length:315 start_codon:yes stop_codon:yes gene_type:complete
VISEERLEKAITYLAHTDEEAAKAKALCKKLEKIERIIRGEAFLKATGTVAEREAKAVTSQDFRDHVAYAENCWVDAELLDNKRHTEEVIIDIWRTMSANLRKV